MKRIFLNKKFLLPAGSFLAVVVILLILQLVASYRAVKAAHKEPVSDKVEPFSSGWNNPEARQLQKDVIWYEQLMEMAKNDSIGLILNLKDSLVQINLKGMYLVQSKILKQHPPGFLRDAGEGPYRRFASVSSIVNEVANLPKKPVKKVVAFSPQNGEKDTINPHRHNKQLVWSFTASNDVRVVITGVPVAADSTLSMNPFTDRVKYNFQDIVTIDIRNKYIPTLYLWMNDKDAKAIFRAVSSRGDVLFRN